MKALDIIVLDPSVLVEANKKRKRKKTPSWLRKTTFQQGPFYGGAWGGYHAWGGNYTTDGGSTGGGGDGGGGGGE